jgi:hypothetical protein
MTLIAMFPTPGMEISMVTKFVPTTSASLDVPETTTALVDRTA